MANVIDLSGLTHTYGGKEILSELFFQPEEGNMALSDWYKIMPNVRGKANLYIPQSLRKLYKKYTTCGRPVGVDNFQILDKQIVVEDMRADLDMCQFEFKDTVFEELLGSGTDIDNLPSFFTDLIRTQIIKGSLADFPRFTWFNDTASADADWNAFDGWLKVINVDVNGAGLIPSLDLSVGQETAGNLNADGALDALRIVVQNANQALRSAEGQRIYITQTVADNLMTTLEDTGTDSGLARIENGKMEMKFRGIPLFVVPEWDSNLADVTNPVSDGSQTWGAGVNIGNNLIVYTEKSSLIVGTDMSDPDAAFKFRMNDDDDELLKVTSKIKLGAQVLHEEFLSIAF